MLKKKKICNPPRSLQPVLLPPKGLLTPHSDQRNIIQQLKQGTLFSSNLFASPPPSISRQLPSFKQEDNWINLIKLGIQQQQTQLPTIFTSEPPPCNLVKHINLKKAPQTAQPGSIPTRCSKLVCFEKKLKGVGAWNKQNKNGMDQNIQRLAHIMGTNRRQLLQNDFNRISGFENNNDTFNQTVISLNEDISMSPVNPFHSLNLTSLANDDSWVSRRKTCLWGRIRKRKYCKTQGSAVPAFLMNSLSVDRQSKKKRGYC